MSNNVWEELSVSINGQTNNFSKKNRNKNKNKNKSRKKNKNKKMIVLEYIISNYGSPCNCDNETDFDYIFSLMGASGNDRVYEDSKTGELFFFGDLNFEDKVLINEACVCNKCKHWTILL